MRRFSIFYTDKNGNETDLLLYYDNIEVAKEENNHRPNMRVEEYTDLTHHQYIEQILEKTSEKFVDIRGRNVYKIIKSFGYVLVRLYFDEKDSTWYDFCEYQINSNNSSLSPITFVCSTPKEFVKKFLCDDFEYKLISYRKYGQPKLTKPKELKGIEKSYSVDFIKNKCRCQVFIKDDDIYIKHRDYFSDELKVDDKDNDKSLSYLSNKYLGKDKAEKFVYDDSWGSIVLRDEAWICLKNIIPLLNISNAITLARLIVEKLEDYHNSRRYEIDLEWERFFEKVILEAQKIYFK